MCEEFENLLNLNGNKKSKKILKETLSNYAVELTNNLKLLKEQMDNDIIPNLELYKNYNATAEHLLSVISLANYCCTNENCTPENKCEHCTIKAMYLKNVS